MQLERDPESRLILCMSEAHMIWLCKVKESALPGGWTNCGRGRQVLSDLNDAASISAQAKMQIPEQVEIASVCVWVSGCVCACACLNVYVRMCKQIPTIRFDRTSSQIKWPSCNGAQFINAHRCVYVNNKWLVRKNTGERALSKITHACRCCTTGLENYEYRIPRFELPNQLG